VSSKIDKDMLRNPDVFVSTSDKVFEYVENHFKTVLTVAVAAILGGVGYAGVNYISAQREQKAAESIYTPEAALKKAEEAFATEPSKVAKLDTKAPPPAKVADYTKDYAGLVDQVKSAIASHADTKAAAVSALNLSYFLLQQKQYPAALEVLSLPKFKPSTTELLGGFWYMHQGLMLFENGQTDAAIESYQSVLKSDALKPFHSEAMLKLGVCYEVKGEVAKARETYDKLSREFPDTEAAQNALQYLRLMQLKSPQQG
jgi:TolA-binding protein